MRLFNYENRFFQFMGRIVDLVLLNLLTLLLCLPVITAGASLSAMYYCNLRYIRGEEGYLHTMFFSQFKKNFKPATVIWLAELLLGLLIYVDINILQAASAQQAMAGIARPIQYLLIAFSVVALFIMQYLLPLVSRYENPLKQYFRNAFLIAVSYFPRTLLMAAIHIALVVVFMIFWVYTLPLYVLIAISGSGYLVMLLCQPIFKRIEENMGTDVPGEEPL